MFLNYYKQLLSNSDKSVKFITVLRIGKGAVPRTDELMKPNFL